jgi:hypothetical protein
LLKKSLKNLTIATLVGLAVSAAYFYISPFKIPNPSFWRARRPIFYDVMIAFFGGVVGAVAITRVEKGNPIAGVAIATALMPPLCTAGYGLAIGNLQFFLGAIYLYSINCFFIAIATFFIIKYLKYPPAKRVDSRHDKRVRYGITFLIIVMILPSFYLAYNLLNEKKISQQIDNFISTEFTSKGYTIIYKKTITTSNPKVLEVAFLEKKFGDDEIEELERKLPFYGINNTRLVVRQDTSNLKNDILSEIISLNENISEKDNVILGLKQQLSSYKFDKPDILTEIGILFPEMGPMSIGRHTATHNTDSSSGAAIVLLYKPARDIPLETTKRLRAWLQKKFTHKPH